MIELAAGGIDLLTSRISRRIDGDVLRLTFLREDRYRWSGGDDACPRPAAFSARANR